MDGISDLLGEPCDTSIQSSMVVTLDTTGIGRLCSMTKREFNPPSLKITKMQETDDINQTLETIKEKSNNI